MRKRYKMLAGLCITAAPLTFSGVEMAANSGQNIKYDAEYIKTYNQHKADCDKEDQALKDQLAALEAETGKKQNIIYFMWDDAAYGRVGHPMLIFMIQCQRNLASIW